MALGLAAFEEAVRTQGPILRRILCRMTCGREDDADDLLQRTFERAWVKRNEFRGGDPGPWLHGIARFEYLTYLRCQQRFLRLRDAVGAAPHDAVEVERDADWRTLSLDECLERLRPLDRTIVDRYYGRCDVGKEGDPAPPMTDVQVAEVLNQDPAWASQGPWRGDRVRKRRHRALAQLRRCVERRGRTGAARPGIDARRPGMDQGKSTLERRNRLSTEALLRYLEEPDAAENAHVRARVAANETDRGDLAAVMALEAALLHPVWEQFAALSDPCTPLEPGLETRLLSIPGMERSTRSTRTDPFSTISGKGLRLISARPGPTHKTGHDSIPERPLSGHVRWYRGAAVAAVLLAGVATWYRFVETGGVQPGDFRWKGETSESGSDHEPEFLPVALWVEVDDGVARSVLLKPTGEGVLEARVPPESRLQVRVNRPERLEPGSGWRAEMTLFLEDHGVRRRLPVPVVRGEADPTDVDLLLGGTLNLGSLSRYGLARGSWLVVEVVQGGSIHEVRIHLEDTEGDDP